MGRASVWKRLLWKELRESWGVVVAMLALPVALFGLSSRYIAGYIGIADVSRLIGSVGTYVLLILWAAGKGDRDKAGNQFSLSHIPVKPIAFWWSSFIVPALISTLLGAWFGWCSTILTKWDVLNIAAGAVEFIAVFAFCYYFSVAISKWLAILLGVIHVVSGGSLIPVWNLEAVWLPEIVIEMAAVAVGAIAASYMFARLANKKTLQVRQIVSLGVMVVIAILPLVQGVDAKEIVQDLNTKPNNIRPLEGSNEPYYVDGVAPGSIILHNRETESMIKRKLPFPAAVVQVTTEGNVYLAQQKQGSNTVDFMLWNSGKNTIKHLTSIPAGRRAIAGFSGASVDTSGRYILAGMGALIGDGSDVWLVDLRRGRGQIVLPCEPRFRITEAYGCDMGVVTWLRDRVYISSYSGSMMRVDLPTMKVEPFNLLKGEGRRGR